MTSAIATAISQERLDERRAIVKWIEFVRCFQDDQKVADTLDHIVSRINAGVHVK